jgi:hypothetical protein
VIGHDQAPVVGAFELDDHRRSRAVDGGEVRAEAAAAGPDGDDLGQPRSGRPLPPQLGHVPQV